MSKTDQTSYELIVRVLPFLAAACMVVCAAVCSLTVAERLDAQSPLALIEAIRKSQTVFLLAAGALLLSGLMLRSGQACRRLLENRSAQRLLLSTFVTLTPLFVPEVGFRPIASIADFLHEQGMDANHGSWPAALPRYGDNPR